MHGVCQHCQSGPVCGGEDTAGEGGTLSCAPSAVTDAGNGAPLNWRPSADAVAGNGRPQRGKIRMQSTYQTTTYETALPQDEDILYEVVDAKVVELGPMG